MLLDLIMTFVVAGVILWLINRVIPMPRRVRTVLTVIVVFAVLVFLLGLVGINI